MSDMFRAAMAAPADPATSPEPGPGGSGTPAAPAPAPTAPAAPPDSLESLEDFDFERPADPATAAPSAPASPEGGDPANPEGAPAPTDPAAIAAAAEAQVRELLAKQDSWTAEEQDRIRGAFLATNGGRKMLEARKVLDALEAPPEIDPKTGQNKGGLGYRPSRDEILQGADASLSMLQVFHDFETNPANWLSNFFGYRDQTGKLVQRPGAAEVLQQIPDHLRRIDPQGELHSQVAKSFLIPYLDQYRQSIMGMPNQTKAEVDAKLRRVQALHDLEFQMTGDFQKIPGVIYGEGQEPYDPAKPDPAAQAKAEIERQRQEIREREQRMVQQRYEATFNAIESSIESDVRSKAETILRAGQLDKIYPPTVFANLVDQFLTQVFEATSGNAQQGQAPRNPRGFQTYRVQADRAARGKLDPNLPVRIYSQLAQDAMRKLVNPFLKSVISQPQAASDAAHQRAMAAQGRSEPAPGGAPAGVPSASGAASNGGSAPDLIRPADKNPGDWARELLRSRLSGGAAAAAISR